MRVLTPADPEAQAIRGYVCEVVRTSADRITAVGRFEDGDRHAVYKVSYLDAVGVARDLVVRVSYGAEPADCVRAEREARVLGRVGGRGAPLLHDFRCTSPWLDAPAMCMQFISGSRRELPSVAPRDIERLGSAIGGLHAQPIDDLVGWLGAPADVASYGEGRLRSILSGLTWVQDPLPALVQERLTAAATLVERSWEARRDTESFTTGESLALLHGDPAAGNILWRPDPVLIDWEYARIGDPADEVAYLFDQSSLGTLQREAFWRGYRDGIGSDARLGHVVERVTWWEPVTLLGSALWWVERWVRRAASDASGTVDPGVPRGQDHYLEHVVRRADRLERLINRERDGSRRTGT